MKEFTSLVKTLLIIGLAVCLAYLLGTTRALGQVPRTAPPPPQAPPVATTPAPLGTPPGPNFSWRYLPGVGWGWVQDVVKAPPMLPTAPKFQSVVGPAPGPACDT